MAGVTSNLYPPIINTYLPAFVINTSGNTTCRIYFSLSVYNSLKEIKNAQVTMCNQKTNASVLNKKTHPSGIILCSIGTDNNKQSDDKYYVDIASADLENGFQINQYYKVQIRFTSAAVPDPSSQSAIDAWLAANTAFFSEWSTICLIRGISQPTLELLNFDESTNTSMTLTQSTLSLVGTLSFKDKEEKETLKSYQARLYNSNKDLLSDSGIIYSNTYSNINEINYIFDYMLEDGMSYILNIDYTTRNLYSAKKEYKFTVIQNTLDKLAADISLDINKEIGSIKVDLVANTAEKFTGFVTFRRASSRTKFTVWEDVHTVAINDSPLNYTWYDYTVESGVWYKYCAQKSDPKGNRGIVTIVEEPIMVIFEDMFFCADKKQLRIKFNPQITSYKKNISESKTDTIGSQYPFIKRNGAMDYRQFSVSGMITIHTDYQDIFASKEELYGNKEIEKLYEGYNEEAKITDYNDYIHEREFREKVIQFLYADNVKLMRTTTEGNVLVRLMDISLSPEQALGRMIYSFSATAYEVDDYTVKNVDKYNISGGIIKINIEEEKDVVDQLLVKKIIKMGQLDQKIPKNIDIISTILTNKYQHLHEDGFDTTVNHLNKMHLEFKTPPYLIQETTAGELIPISGDQPIDKFTMLGYIIRLNGIDIYVSPEGIYELVRESEIFSLSFPVDCEATIDYIAVIHKTETYSHKTDMIYFYNKVGQIWGSFEYQDSIFRKLWNKYYGEYKQYYQKLISINSIRIEADPSTVCWIKDSSSSELKRFIINDSGSLSLYDDNYVIEGLYFSGIHMELANQEDLQRDILPYNKYIETGIVVENLENIKNPIPNGVYTLNKYSYQSNMTEYPKKEDTIEGVFNNDIQLVADDIYALLIEQILESSNQYIYYHGKWRLFTKDKDILCNVDAIIDYWCEVMKGVHLL